MRIRTVKPEFFTSPDTARASVEARLLYIALWCLADDYGVGEANMNQILGAAFPESDQRTREEVQSLCNEVSAAYGTVFYSVSGRHYYAIPSWDDHQKTQRRANRRNPGPDHPDSVPDQRFNDTHGTSEQTQGSSVSKQGDSPLGKGKGTGEREQGKGNSAQARSDYSPEFETFWSTYPRREAKRQAWNAWCKALNRATVEAITEGALRYAQDPNRDDKYTKHAATWLNADGWEDDPLPSRHNVQDLPKPSKSRGWLDAGQSLTNGGGLRAIGN